MELCFNTIKSVQSVVSFLFPEYNSVIISRYLGSSGDINIVNIGLNYEKMEQDVCTSLANCIVIGEIYHFYFMTVGKGKN